MKVDRGALSYILMQICVGPQNTNALAGATQYRDDNSSNHDSRSYNRLFFFKTKQNRCRILDSINMCLRHESTCWGA